MIKRTVATLSIIASIALFQTEPTDDTNQAVNDYSVIKALIESPRPRLQADTLLGNKRQQFADVMMDYAEHENERLTAVRALLPGILERQAGQEELDPALALLLTHFEIEEDLYIEQIKHELYVRIDGLPPAIVATQAAIESAWGESRFAVLGNNYFGHQCYSEGCGIKPKNSSNPSLEVRKFDTVGDSVAAYYQNINTHPAYSILRNYRYMLRMINEPMTTEALIPTLKKYSEIGEEYLTILESVYRSKTIQSTLAVRGEMSSM